MKTVFKVGQKVYDQVFRKDKKGSVSFISMDKYKPYIFVDFEDSIPAVYTFDGVFLNISEESVTAHSFPTLSSAPYDVGMKGFEQKPSFPTVEDANNWLRITGQFFDVDVNYDKERYTSKEVYEAFEALKSLIVLRDYYNSGWKADWRDDTYKYVIISKVDIRWELLVDNKTSFYSVLHFKSREIAHKFIKEQKELLEIAKPLL